MRFLLAAAVAWSVLVPAAWATNEVIAETPAEAGIIALASVESVAADLAPAAQDLTLLDTAGLPPVEEVVLPPVEEVVLPPVEEVVLPPVEEVAPLPVEEVVLPPVEEVVVPPVEEVVLPPVEEVVLPPVEEVVPPPIEEAPPPLADETAGSREEGADVRAAPNEPPALAPAESAPVEPPAESPTVAPSEAPVSPPPVEEPVPLAAAVETAPVASFDRRAADPAQGSLVAPSSPASDLGEAVVKALAPRTRVDAPAVFRLRSPELGPANPAGDPGPASSQSPVPPPAPPPPAPVGGAGSASGQSAGGFFFGGLALVVALLSLFAPGLSRPICLSAAVWRPVALVFRSERPG